MIIRDISEVGARLEKATMASSVDRHTPIEKYLLYEEIAIAILDSEHMDYPEGELEAYLMAYLARKRLEFGLDLG